MGGAARVEDEEAAVVPEGHEARHDVDVVAERRVLPERRRRHDHHAVGHVPARGMAKGTVGSGVGET